jgi:hypothetical protein
MVVQIRISCRQRSNPFGTHQLHQTILNRLKTSLHRLWLEENPRQADAEFLQSASICVGGKGSSRAGWFFFGAV